METVRGLRAARWNREAAALHTGKRAEHDAGRARVMKFHRPRQPGDRQRYVREISRGPGKLNRASGWVMRSGCRRGDCRLRCDDLRCRKRAAINADGTDLSAEVSVTGELAAANPRVCRRD